MDELPRGKPRGIIIPQKRDKIRLTSSGGLDRLARGLVQAGFLFLFLFPLLPPIYKHLTHQSAPEHASWLLAWDPLLAFGNLLNGNFSALIIGAPLLLLALSLVLGRSFCGWVCPVGTAADLLRLPAVWQKRRKAGPSRADGRRNSRMRYLLLAIVLGGSLLSIKLLGLIDPLVIYSRAAAGSAVTVLGGTQDLERGALTYLSLLFIGILILELWRPRFWCRHLSLLNRRVDGACLNCGECKRVCPMNAIPQDAHNTDYGDCTFCLECESACPQKAVGFGFGGLALAVWQPHTQETQAGRTDRRSGEYVASASVIPGGKLSRRQMLQGMAGVAAGLVIPPLTVLDKSPTPLRPPGALPEADFLNVCIACQECVRICPTHGLRAAFLQAGLSRLGTPLLVPRLGGCALGVSCDHLCMQVCPVDAILPLPGNKFKIGTAQVDHSLCLTWDQGVKCLVCVESCQYHAASVFQERVIVREENCVGCGFCESGCPVPGAAIHVEPVDS
jgi:ferredoxin